MLLLGLRLAARAAVGIEDDEEDLFYETGRTTQALLQALVSLCLWLRRRGQMCVSGVLMDADVASRQARQLVRCCCHWLVAEVVHTLLVKVHLCCGAAVGIEGDEEDLFYDTGRTTQAQREALLQALVNVSLGF